MKSPAVVQTLPVYLINLDRSPDRLDFMRRQFGAAGVSFTRLSAADGRDPDVLRRSRRSRLSQLSPGEIGCFESHIRAWEMLLASNAAAAIVTEDDIIISNRFLEIAEAAAREVDFEVIKLDFFSNAVRVEDKVYAEPFGRKVFRYLGGDWCTGAYLVSRSGAARLLAGVNSHLRPVDHYMYDVIARIVYSARIFSVVPAVAVQTDSNAVGTVPFSSNVKDGTGPKRTAWVGRVAQILSWVRFDAGPVNRFLCARQLARLTREIGVRNVQNAFVLDQPS